MGTTTTHLFQFQFQYLNPLRVIDSPPPQFANPKFLARRNNYSNGRCRCTSSGGREGGSRWYSDDNTSRSKPLNFNLDEDDDGNFGFKSGAETNSKRNWWSGDNIFDDEDEDEEEEDGFGVLEDSVSGIAWITKVLKAFGWMVPAILLSMLVGTGPNAFFMALALPLAQSALSLVFDTFWGRANEKSRYKSRTKRRPFARTASNVGTSKEKEASTGNEASFKNGERSSSSNFGGWDELDKQKRTDKSPFTTQARKSMEQSQLKKGFKLSRTVRKREKPLAIRLLIAVFPFLGSWTRFL